MVSKPENSSFRRSKEWSHSKSTRDSAYRWMKVGAQVTSGGSKTPVRSAETIYVGNFFRRQNASGGRIRRSISIIGRGESGWKEGVEEIIRKSRRTPTVERFLIANSVTVTSFLFVLQPKETCKILNYASA
jgi:hypothetical protein